MLGTSYGTGGEDQYGYSFSDAATFLQPQPDRGSPPAPGTDITYRAFVNDTTFSQHAGSPQGVSLRDEVEGQDWLLQRIVGSIFVACGAAQSQFTLGEVWTEVIATVGILVARAEDDNGTIIDMANADDYDPQAVDNTANPWVWRRSWALSMPVSSLEPSPPGPFRAVWPMTNAGYNSMREGTHIDSKVKRRVLREQRLWMVSRVSGWSGQNAPAASGAQDLQPPVSFTSDVRIYGAMRRGRNRSAF